MFQALKKFPPYKVYARILKWLTLSLLAYPLTVFIVAEPWPTILRATFLPRIELSFAFLFVITGVLGTTISPYMFFWQASEEFEPAGMAHLSRYRLGCRRHVCHPGTLEIICFCPLSPRPISQRPRRLMPSRGITTFGLAHPPPSPPGDTLRGWGRVGLGWLRCSDAPCGHQGRGAAAKCVGERGFRITLRDSGQKP